MEGFEGGLSTFEGAEIGFSGLTVDDEAADTVVFGSVVADFFEFGVNLGEGFSGFEGEIFFGELGLDGGELGEAGFVPVFFGVEDLGEVGFEGGEFGGMGAVGGVERMKIGDLRLQILNKVIGFLQEFLVGAVLVTFIFALSFKFDDEAGAVFGGKGLAAQWAICACGLFETINPLFEIVHFGAEAGVFGFGFGLAVEGSLEIGFEGGAVGEGGFEIGDLRLE